MIEVLIIATMAITLQYINDLIIHIRCCNLINILGGRYLYNEKETRSLEATYDPELQRQLWARSCQLTGIADVTWETFSGSGLPGRA